MLRETSPVQCLGTLSKPTLPSPSVLLSVFLVSTRETDRESQTDSGDALFTRVQGTRTQASIRTVHDMRDVTDTPIVSN